ncbi:MAG: hypothetical protein QGG14_06345 [Planctomycetota bacterium]|nr:hypothetical protein [Planctomycetota bacterium]
MERNAEAAADMSVGLSELAVDLGSFFNAADTDVLQALRAGITGEAEPLKRFGIVMQDATLEAFRLSQGINKSFKSMSIAEKTALRYNFILDQTVNAQGDAARTSEGWANASKGLISAFKDLGTRLGLTLLPFVEKVAIAVRNTVRGFLEWQKGTRFLQSVLIVLGAIGAKIAAGLILAWLPVLLPFIKFAAIVTLAALILDDFLTFMAGGDSVIGRFIESIFGPGSAAAAADGLRMAWEGVVLFWKQEVVPALAFVKDAFLSDAQAMSEAFGAFFSDFGEWIFENEKLLIGFSDTILKTLNAAAKLVGIDLNLETTEARLARTSAERAGERRRGMASSAIRDGAPLSASIAQASAAAQIDNSVTVNVQGGATARDATRIAGGVEEAQRRQARRSRAALTQVAEQ